ncbi:MAG: M48 family metalloprotease [Proteobacteria bacterium]|jgi:hypothetical protein|nr:M48 family metalloprotease [Pseudomonadota bacterium]
MEPHTVRCESDRHLAVQLLLDERVSKMRDKLREQGKMGTRRSLLAKALRLSSKVAPNLHEIKNHCVEVLAAEIEIELYVFASPSFNAGCTPVEDERVFILISSSMLEAFSTDELQFVLGHELGHHIYGHHEVPLPFILQAAKHLPAAFVLQASAWQRYAEISADRAGMLCCGGQAPAARSLFKLSSGLREAPGAAQIKAFVEQAYDLYEESQAAHSVERIQHHDFLSSHPFSPVRLRAARSFDSFMKGKQDLPAVEREVLSYMALMEPSYLDEDSPGAEAMRRLLFAAGAVVAAANGEIAKEEIEALKSLLGLARVPDTLKPELLRQHLAERIEKVKELVVPSRRAQLIRDLALIARADGHVDDEEVAEMRSLAAELEVDPTLVETVLQAPVEVD